MSPCLLESGLWILLWGLESGVFITSSPLLSFCLRSEQFQQEVHFVGGRSQEFKLELIQGCGVSADEAPKYLDELPKDF